MSKFDYANFYGNCMDVLAVSKEKYTREQAVEIAKIELEVIDKPYYIAIGDGYVRHRAGRDEDGECCVGWWLEYEEHNRSCPCWIFHRTTNVNEWRHEKYEYIHISATVEEVQE